MARLTGGESSIERVLLHRTVSFRSKPLNPCQLVRLLANPVRWVREAPFKERFEPRPLLNKTCAALFSLLLAKAKLCEQRT